jgi:hypothetical protein
VSVLAEQIAARALRRYLLSELPAKVAEVNATRAPVLESPYKGPFTISGTKKLRVSLSGIDTGHLTTAALIVGAARTAAQIAAEVNATAGLAGVASADSDGRLLLTGAAPSSGNSVVALGSDDPTAAGSNAVFGWDAGGERVLTHALVAPTFKGVADGLPFFPDMGPGFWLIIGKRTSVPVRRANSTVRTDEYQVGLELGFMFRETNVQSHRSREGISSCVRCVRELLLSNTGRQLGRAQPGDIVLVEEKNCTIEGMPYSFKGKDQPKGFFDRALMLLSIRVFERPTP